MAKLKITTNIPCLRPMIFDYKLQIVETKKRGTSNPIPYLTKSTETSSSKEEVIEIELKPGLYKVRLELPYCNPSDVEPNENGTMYLMPVVMDKLIDLPKDDSIIHLKFLATLSEELAQD